MSHSSNSDSTLDTLIDRVLAGEATAAEQATLKTWVARSPQRRDQLDRLRAAWTAMGTASVDVTAAQARVRQRLTIPSATGSPPKKSAGAASRRTFGRWRGEGEDHGDISWRGSWRAASALLGVGIMVFALLRGGIPLGGTTRTYATTTGQMATVTLDDGSHATLAPRTTLRLSHFGRRSRTVDVDGQVYFDVAHSTDAPFIVRTNGVATRVLGTQFIVQHYRDDENVRVTVLTGRVAINARSRDRATIVAAGQTGEVTDSTPTVYPTTNAGAETGWLHDELRFTHAPVPEVLRTLTRWYGYTFRSADSSVIQQKVTVWVSTRSSARALTALKQVLDVDMTFTGDTITLTPLPQHAGSRGARRNAYDVWVPPSREVGR